MWWSYDWWSITFCNWFSINFVFYLAGPHMPAWSAETPAFLATLMGCQSPDDKYYSLQVSRKLPSSSLLWCWKHVALMSKNTLRLETKLQNNVMLSSWHSICIDLYADKVTYHTTHALKYYYILASSSKFKVSTTIIDLHDTV